MTNNRKDESAHIIDLVLILCLATILLCSGCSSNKNQLTPALTTPDVLMIHHHIESNMLDIEYFCQRLYLKNPIYEANIQARTAKLNAIFHPPEVEANAEKNHDGIQQPTPLPYDTMLSHQLLEAAFSATPPTSDRIYLLALGMKKSIVEGYDGYDQRALLSGMLLSVKKLEKLHLNLQQLNWRLKTYRNANGQLLFLTNAATADGYINMGYEVIMTRILTRIGDDIYMRDGQTPNFIFSVSTLFLPLLL